METSKFNSHGRQAPKPSRRRRIPQQALQGLISAAARQRECLPLDHPRRKPTLPRVRFLEQESQDPQVSAVDPAEVVGRA
jgi:hypothetical protein